MSKEIIWLTMHKPNLELLQRVSARRRLTDVEVRYTALGDLYATVEACVAAGAKVLILRGGLAAEVKARFSVPVVDVKHTYIDFFDLMQRAHKVADRFALIGWYSNVKGLSRLKDAMGQNLIYVELDRRDIGNDEDKLRRILVRMYNSGIPLVVGGGAVTAKAG